MDKSMKPVEQKWCFPKKGVTITAATYKEAVLKLKKKKV